MEIEGKIIRDLPLQEGISRAGNPWKKKEWVLETFEQYPRQVCFHFFGDRVDQNPLKVGESYSISFDIESREFNGRWYTDIRAFASRPLDGAQPAYGQQPPVAEPYPGYQQPQAGFAQGMGGGIGSPRDAEPGAANDDLPF